MRLIGMVCDSVFNLARRKGTFVHTLKEKKNETNVKSNNTSIVY